MARSSGLVNRFWKTICLKFIFTMLHFQCDAFYEEVYGVLILSRLSKMKAVISCLNLYLSCLDFTFLYKRVACLTSLSKVRLVPNHVPIRPWDGRTLRDMTFLEVVDWSCKKSDQWTPFANLFGALNLVYCLSKICTCVSRASPFLVVRTNCGHFSGLSL